MYVLVFNVQICQECIFLIMTAKRKPIYEHMSTGWFPHQPRANKQVDWGYKKHDCQKQIIRQLTCCNGCANAPLNGKNKYWIMMFVYAKYSLFPNIRQLYIRYCQKPIIVSIFFYTSKLSGWWEHFFYFHPYLGKIPIFRWVETINQLWLSPYRFFSSFIISDDDWSSITTFRAQDTYSPPKSKGYSSGHVCFQRCPSGIY